MNWYDREGRLIGMMSAARLLQDRDHKIVQQDHVGEWWVSTVWLGLDHNWLPSGPPLIFETMVFGPSWVEGFSERYPTEAAAREGHEAAVAGLSGAVRPCGRDCADVMHELMAGARQAAMETMFRIARELGS